MAYVHHLIIHFPIAFATLAALLAVYGLIRSSNEWVRAASVLTMLTALVAFAAAGSGLIAAGHFVEGGGDAKAVALHRNLALGATALLVIAAVISWRETRAGAATGSRAAGALSILGAVVVSAAGHYGGELLHAGMAPWSEKPHSHGSMGGGANGADGHPGNGDDHGGAPTSSASAGPHAGMGMGTTTDAGALDGGAVDAGMSSDHGAMPGMGSAAPAPTTKPPPAGHENDHAH